MDKPRRGPRPVHHSLEDRDWLYERYEVRQRTAGEIGEELGCSRSAVTRALKRFDFEIRQGGPGAKRRVPELLDREWLVEAAQTKTPGEIADDLGCSSYRVLAAFDRLSIERPRRRFRSPETRNENIRQAMKARFPSGRRGELAGNWKGGKPYKTKSGYVMVYVPDHPRGPRVLEHILVAEKKIGRYLRPGETVDHLNEIRDDNRASNLEVRLNRAHGKRHSVDGKALRARIAYLESLLREHDIPFAEEASDARPARDADDHAE